MNVKSLYMLPILLFSYHVIDAAADGGSPPILPGTVELVSNAGIQFGTFGKQPIEESGDESKRFKVRVSQKELHQLGKQIPCHWTLLTQEELARIGKEPPVDSMAWQERYEEAETDLSKQLYGMMVSLAALTQHKAQLNNSSKLASEQKKLKSEISGLAQRMPGDLRLFLERPETYCLIKDFVELFEEKKNTELELRKQKQVTSIDTSIKCSKLEGTLRSQWNSLDPLMFKDWNLIKNATLEKRKQTDDPSATLTDEELSELILKEKFSFLYESCSNKDEILIIEKLFSKVAGDMLVHEKIDPKQFTSSIEDEMNPHTEAMHTAHKMLYTGGMANSIQEALSEGDSNKMTHILIQLKKTLRILTSAFPEEDVKTTLKEKSSSKPITTIIEDGGFELLDEEKKEEEAQQTESQDEGPKPNESSSYLGRWFDLNY